MNYDTTKVTWNGKPINIYKIKYKKEFEMKDIKDNQPKICELLGIELNKKFNIMGNEFLKCYNPFVLVKDECDYIIYDNEDDELDMPALISIINGDLHIEEYIELTNRQKEIFKALKVLGINYITKDEDGEIFGYKNHPIKDSWDNWYDNANSTNIYLDEFQDELSPFIENAKSTPLDISTLDLD